MLHEEGLDLALSYEEAQRLTQTRNHADWKGCHLLEEALRGRFEAEEQWDLCPHDTIIVYPMPFGIDELQECLDYFCERADEKQWFKVIDGDEQFEPMTVETLGGKTITFEYTEISELVDLVNQRLEEKGEARRFFRLDGHEYEGVYYLMPIETKERLAKKGVLDFVDD